MMIMIDGDDDDEEGDDEVYYDINYLIMKSNIIVCGPNVLLLMMIRSVSYLIYIKSSDERDEVWK